MQPLRAIPRPHDLIGTIRRFGETGPVYIVRSVVDDHIGDDALLRIEIPETGEELELPYLTAIFDPVEEA